MRYNRQSFTTGKQNNSEGGNIKLLFGVIWCRVWRTKLFSLKLITFTQWTPSLGSKCNRKALQIYIWHWLTEAKSPVWSIHSSIKAFMEVSKVHLIMWRPRTPKTVGYFQGPQAPHPFFRNTSSYYSPSKWHLFNGGKATCLTITRLKFKYTLGI